MLRKTVSDPYSGDWKSSVAVGWESGTGNRQFIRLSGTQTPSKLRLGWMMKIVRLHVHSSLWKKSEIWPLSTSNKLLNRSILNIIHLTVTDIYERDPFRRFVSPHETSCRLHVYSWFYRNMPSQDVCPCVRLSVSPSVTCRYFIDRLQTHHRIFSTVGQPYHSSFFSYQTV